MLGRFFKRLEQRIECGSREHVNFIDDINLELRRSRGVPACIPQLTNLFHAIVAGAIDFKNIHRTSLGNLLALGIVNIEISLRTIGAVQCLGENARESGLAGSTRAAKKIGVGDPVFLNGMRQRLAHVFLADHICKPLRTIFPGYDLIGHQIQDV
jgi:hypothetical protein